MYKRKMTREGDENVFELNRIMTSNLGYTK